MKLKTQSNNIISTILTIDRGIRVRKLRISNKR